MVAEDSRVMGFPCTIDSIEVIMDTVKVRERTIDSLAIRYNMPRSKIKEMFVNYIKESKDKVGSSIQELEKTRNIYDYARVHFAQTKYAWEKISEVYK